MNTSIIELQSALTTNNVKDIKNGVIVLESFFNEFTFHPHKDEFMNMNNKDKKVFVKTLLDSIVKTENNPSNIVSETIPNESNEILPGNDLGVKIEENSDDKEESLNELLQQDIQLCLTERDELLLKLQEVNNRLSELGYNSNDSGSKTKVQIVKEWFNLNPEYTRKQFMEHFSELGSKSLLSTYYQAHKPK
jgi:hypothetical protein